jgi:hypothetical protein
MGTFAEMEQRIIAEMHRDDVAAVVDDYINDAIKHYARYRFWFNEKKTSMPTAEGVEYYDWPIDLVELDRLLITYNSILTPLDRVSPEELDDIGVPAQTGGTTNRSKPYCYSLYAKQFRLYPKPDAIYLLTLNYLVLDDRIPLPTGSTAVTVWTTEAEELIRTRAKKLLVGQFIPTSQDTVGWIQLLEQNEQRILQGLQRQTQASTATGRLRRWDA